MAASMPIRRSRRRWRRGLALVAAAAALTTTTTFWLANSGAVSIPSAPTPAGVSTGGDIASFTALDPSTVTPSRGGQSVPGMALGKFTFAAGYANRLKIDLAWLDPKDAGSVLHNQNAWIAFGLYEPIHTGSCTTETDSVTVTDGTTYCMKHITQVSGKLIGSGTLTLGQTLLSGYMTVDASDPSSPTTCGSGTSSWCAPSGLTNQNVVYVIATIYNAGGNAPPGQQGQSGTLDFYMAAQAVS